MTERIVRSTANGGSVQRTRASSTVTFGAMDAPSAGWGTASSDPSAMPSRVAASSPAPEELRRSSSDPAVSSSAIFSVTVPKTGPVSMPSSSRKVVAPVISSPARIAAWTGAAPRQAGSSEKCRFTQPNSGTARAATSSASFAFSCS